MYNENKIKLLKSISSIAIGILLILVTGFNIPVPVNLSSPKGRLNLDAETCPV